MPKIVYVPQGRVARLHKGTFSYDINGLYTDHFSTCNILIVKTKNCVELAHIDTQVALAPQQMEDEIEGLKNADEITLISREKKGVLLQGNLMQYFKEAHPKKKIITRIIDSQHDGVLVSVRKNSDDELEANIETHPIGQRPENLIHHPNEQQIQTVHKIRQIIGLQEISESNILPNNFYCIFDGRSWDYVNSSEVELKSNNPITKKEIEFFSSKDCFITVAGKLAGIIEAAKKDGLQVPVGVTWKELAYPVACDLENYLNDYNYSLLFKRNISEMLTNNQNFLDYIPNSGQDKHFKEEALKILQKSEDVFEIFQNLVENYKQNAPSTKFKDSVLNEICIYSRHYNEGKSYANLAEQRKNSIDKAKKINGQAFKSYQDKNYAAAINLFMDSLKLFTYHCAKSDPLLITAYYNLGRTFFKDDDCSTAKFNLETALVLRKEFHPDDKAGIEKIEKALQDCEAKLKQETIEEKIATLKM